MSSRSNVARKTRTNVLPRITLENYQDVKFSLPPVFRGLEGLQFAMVFDGNTVKAGFVKQSEVTFIHPMDEVMRANQLPGILRSVKSEKKEDRGAEIATAVLGAKPEPKLLQQVSQLALNVENVGDNLEKLASKINDRFPTEPIEIGAKKVLLRVIAHVRKALGKFAQNPLGFKLKEEIQKFGVPTEFVMRLTAPGLNIDQMDLIKIIFPNDGKRALALTYNEIANHGLATFAEVIFPQNKAFVEFLKEYGLHEHKVLIDAGLDDAKKFKWRFLPPVSLKEMWKYRETTVYRMRSGTRVSILDSWNQVFYGLPWQTIMAPWELLDEAAKYILGGNPKLDADKKALMPEAFKIDAYEQPFFKKLLNWVLNQDFSTMVKTKAVLIPEVDEKEYDAEPGPNSWKVDTSKVNTIMKAGKKMPPSSPGPFPVEGPACRRLVDALKTSQYKAGGRFIMLYLSNFKGTLQQHMANVLYTQLFLGEVEQTSSGGLLDEFPEENPEFEETDD